MNTTTKRLTCALLILSSLCVYLEWGTNNSTYLIAAEAEVIRRLFTQPQSALHPFTIIPLAGQLLLAINILLTPPRRWLFRLGAASVGILVLFIFIIGLIGLNFKIALLSLPFLFCATVALLRWKKTKPNEKL